MKLSTVFLYLAGFAGATLASVPELVNVSNSSNTRSFSVCCQDFNLLSCSQANIDPAVLGQTTLALPNGLTLTFSNMVEGISTGYYYSGQGGDAVISYNPDTGSMFAHASTYNGDSFVLEGCGDEGHVWKQIDVASLGDDEGVPLEEVGNDGVNGELHQRLVTDNTTVITYSVKFYYTPQFQAVTPDIEGFVDSVVAETNQGYINSKVPIRVSKLCTELATINDESSARTVLSKFRTMKSSVAELRDTADAAALLVNNFGSCGIGYLNVIGSGTTVTATKKSCALGYYSFGHELGHNIGLHHNVEVATNTAYSYGHGHLIASGTANTGVRSILAYSASGHSQRVHYYSNPAVIYPGTGTPTGIVGVSNNAAVLMQNRFSLANIGDETSVSCGSATVTTLTQTPATTTTTTITSTQTPITTTTSATTSTQTSTTTTMSTTPSTTTTMSTTPSTPTPTTTSTTTAMSTSTTTNGTTTTTPTTTTMSTNTTTPTLPGSCESCTTVMSDTKTTYKVLKRVKKNTLDECSQLCSNNPECAKWNFKKAKKQKGNRCILNKFQTVSQSKWFTGVPSPCSSGGPNETTTPTLPGSCEGCSMVMSDTKTAYNVLERIKKNTLDECSQLCSNSPECVKWNFKKARKQRGNKCFLYQFETVSQSKWFTGVPSPCSSGGPNETTTVTIT